MHQVFGHHRVQRWFDFCPTDPPKKHSINLSKTPLVNQENSTSSPSPLQPASDQGNTTIEPPKKIQKITNYLDGTNSNTVEYAVSRMAALDGIPLNTIVKSKDIQLGLNARNLIGKADTFYLVRGCITKMSKEVRELIRSLLMAEKKRGVRFSITIDEWTSVGNARYLTITIHTLTGFHNLGMLRILSTLDAKSLLQSVTKFLNECGINLDEDIVGVTSDGAPVMAKFGTLFKAQQQLCYAHAIQLAVVKVLHKFKQIEER